jgi:carbamoyltransferase
VEAIYLELVDLREDASFTLNKQYFNYSNSLAVTNGASDKLLVGRRASWRPSSRSTRSTLARSIQVVCEEYMLRMARTVHRKTGSEKPVSSQVVPLDD